MTSHPSHRPVSALRARMIEDMRVRGFAEKTCSDYARCSGSDAPTVTPYCSRAHHRCRECIDRDAASSRESGFVLGVESGHRNVTEFLILAPWPPSSEGIAAASRDKHLAGGLVTVVIRAHMHPSLRFNK